MLFTFPLQDDLIIIVKTETVSSLFDSVTGALKIQNAERLAVKRQEILMLSLARCIVSPYNSRSRPMPTTFMQVI